MKKAEWEKLLERFMDGKTTVEEEVTLADWFRHASDADKPKGMADDDWKAYREMFRQFDEGFDETGMTSQRNKRRPLWAWMSVAAAVAALVVLVLNMGGDRVVNEVAVAMPKDTAKQVLAPVDTVREGNVETAPLPERKPKKLRRSPYGLPVPRPLLASTPTPAGISEDSMAIAMEEAERLVEAMSIYQEIRINEICNVEYEEQY